MDFLLGRQGKACFTGQHFWSGLYLFALFWLTGCGNGAQLPAATAVSPVTPVVLPPTPVVSGPTAQADASPTPQPSATATAVPPLTISAEAGVPGDLVARAQALPAPFAWVDDASSADVVLTLGHGEPLAEWVYVVAAPFATFEDEISLLEVEAKWQARAPSPWRVFAEDGVFWPMAGPLGPARENVTFVPNELELVERAWAERPSLVILPFHELRPDLKLLRLDGASPLMPGFDMGDYPLTVAVNVAGEETAVGKFLAVWDGPASNWDPAKLTRVAMSGVTALTRATAYQMEIGDILAPGQAVGPVLQTADIAHVSNEVSFTPECPYPNPIGGTLFCSHDAYFELLAWLGIDVVELTGNHVNDWGTDALLHSLDLYADAGMAVFGGGANIEAALQPAVFEHNGNRIAFVGCNPVGPPFAWAGADKPGARPCDDGFTAQVTELAAEGYLVIATLQYHEYYHYAATAQQKVDFAALAQAGAAAVSGSQAHHAQGFAFVEGAFIHYGLGNLFFDQMDQLGTRQTFVDSYVFYDGRLLSVELWTGLIENYCCPRVMTDAERRAVLTAVFQASGW